MKTLVLDIETSPNLGYFFGDLYNNNLGIDQLKDSTQMLCFAAKWLHEKPITFYGLNILTREEMVTRAWELLDEADAVIHFNGQRFDIPHINRECMELGLHEPSPFKHIDLLKTAKKKFAFTSNKLDYITRHLHIGVKYRHDGFATWLGCMNDDPAAWRKMALYNKRDVGITEHLYHRWLPWIYSHPNMLLYTDDVTAPRCPRCLSARIHRDGPAYTAQSVFDRYRCQKCGKCWRGTRRIAGVNVVEAL